MKITSVRRHILQGALSEPLASAHGWYDTRTAMLVEIEIGEGLVDRRECYGPAAMTAALVGRVRPRLVGEDPLRTEYLCRSSMSACALTATRVS